MESTYALHLQDLSRTSPCSVPGWVNVDCATKGWGDGGARVVMTQVLDNPFWAALGSRHQSLAVTGPGWARYPAEIAPFLGVADADVDLGDALAPGEQVYLLGVLPRIPAGWVLTPFAALAQMVCERPLDVIDGLPILPLLSDADRRDVLELTAQVYPHYFRPRTMDLGRYYGLRVEEQLVAMIGERLGTDHAQELSAICTHPDHLGRGHAQRLTAWLTNATLAQGLLPFLHVSYANTRAKALYDRWGYRVRADLPFWALRRP